MGTYWHHALCTLRAAYVTLRRLCSTADIAMREATFRGLPRLRVDAEGISLCIACGACVEACPPQCIRVAGQATRIHFELDAQRCMYCDICVEVCPVEALNSSDSAPSLVVRDTDPAAQRVTLGSGR